MTKPRDTARLFWGGSSLWLGPWKAATLEPVWYGDRRDIAPHGWQWSVGPHSGDAQQHIEALSMAEWVVMGQLRAVGILAAEFHRQDGVIRKVEMP